MSQAITSRRAFLRAALTLPAGAMLAACIAPTSPAPAPSIEAGAAPTPAVEMDAVATGAAAAEATPPTLEPTLACGDDDEPTIAQTEGPTTRLIHQSALHSWKRGLQGENFCSVALC